MHVNQRLSQSSVDDEVNRRHRLIRAMEVLTGITSHEFRGITDFLQCLVTQALRAFVRFEVEEACRWSRSHLLVSYGPGVGCFATLVKRWRLVWSSFIIPGQLESDVVPKALARCAIGNLVDPALLLESLKWLALIESLAVIEHPVQTAVAQQSPVPRHVPLPLHVDTGRTVGGQAVIPTRRVDQS